MNMKVIGIHIVKIFQEISILTKRVEREEKDKRIEVVMRLSF